MANVEVKDVKKAFEAVEVIKGVDLNVKDREFVVFVGPSGCGKSTLLRMIAGLEEITSGDVVIDGVRVNDVPPDARGLAMVFQSYALYPHMSVADNMGFALRLAGVSKEERASKVLAAARILRLEPLLARKPGQLSGGQRQRVAIGRAIVRNPKVFLFDEPLSNLDAALRVQMRVELAKLHRELKATMIYVTHDQVEAMTMADRIVVLNQGLVEQVGSPLELYHRPTNRFVAGFIGSPNMNFIEVKAAGASAQGVAVQAPGGETVTIPVAGPNVKAGDTLTLGVRPEHLEVAASGALSGPVTVIERLGGHTYLYVQVTPANLVIVLADGDIPVEVGENVKIAIEPKLAHLFGGDGAALAHLGPMPRAEAANKPRIMHS
jgi:multiple sugar transport system ATP-binding protein